uniref:GATA-type domain-containing protein n=1 Tax=Meloidogyne enterolobii TaxID=390850 RepID=A0A6V7VVE8_MELEN|nr:unnamed protein product [Meloidogyne enterolobii]
MLYLLPLYNLYDDRKCFICNITQTICWRRHSETGKYLCNACGCKQRKEITKKRSPKI